MDWNKPQRTPNSKLPNPLSLNSHPFQEKLSHPQFLFVPLRSQRSGADSHFGILLKSTAAEVLRFWHFSFDSLSAMRNSSFHPQKLHAFFSQRQSGISQSARGAISHLEFFFSRFLGRILLDPVDFQSQNAKTLPNFPRTFFFFFDFRG